MKSERKAVIDIGTNSVKLLVAEVCGQSVRPLHSLSEVTRLGQGAHASRRLHPEAIARTAQVVMEFAEAAKGYAPVCIRTVATSAAREAANKAELLEAIENAIKKLNGYSVASAATRSSEEIHS